MDRVCGGKALHGRRGAGRGAASGPDCRRAGPAAGPETSVLVGLPPTGEVSLAIREAVAGRPWPVDTDETCGQEPARLGAAGWMRGQRLAQLVVGCQRLTDGTRLAYDRVVVDLRFTPSPGRAATAASIQSSGA